MLLQMLLGSMDLLQCNKLESSSVFLCVGYPLFSNRAMISPTRPLMTPSGLIAMKVCSADILGVSTICSCELKSFESWNPWAVVLRLRSTVTIRKAFDMHVAKFPLVNLQRIAPSLTLPVPGAQEKSSNFPPLSILV